MKKAGKIFLYTLISIFLFVILLVVIAGLAQNRIVRLALDQVSKTTDIPIQVGDIQFSLIQRFPLATLECKNLLISSPDTLENSRDTLLNAGNLYVSFEVKPLLKGIFEVKKVEIQNADAFYRVDSIGKSNYDFLIDTTQTETIDTSSNSIYLNVETLQLQNVRCHYRDNHLKAGGNLLVDELNLSGLIDNQQYSGQITGQAHLTQCYAPETRLERMKSASIQFNMNYQDDTLAVQQADIDVDDNAQMALKGYINISKSLMADLSVQARNVNIAGLTQYVPSQYLKDYGIQSPEGKLNLDAHVTGNLTDSVQLPHVDATLQLYNGRVQYGEYPEINNIALNANVTNGSSNNNRTTRLNIHSLSFRAANSAASLTGTVENLECLSYSFHSKLNLAMSDWKPFIPDSIVQGIDGNVRASLSSHGTLPDSITAPFINSVAANTTLDLTASKLNVAVDSLLSVRNLTGRLRYQPGNLRLDSLSAQVPAYHLNLKYLDLNSDITGEFTQPDSLQLAIHQLHLQTDSSDVQLQGTLKNPTTPDYSLDGKLRLNLAEVYSMLPDSLANGLSGTVSADIQSAAKINLDSITSQLNDVLFNRSHFSLALGNVTVDMPDSLMCVQNLSGNLNYKDDTLRIGQLNGKYLGLHFGAQATTVSNIYTAAILNTPKELTVHGDFSVDSLDYALIDSFLKSDSLSASSAQPEQHADTMKFTYKVNGTFHANQLKYGTNLFTNVDTKFLVKENYYVLDSMAMDAYSGKALTSLKIELNPEGEMDMYFKTNVDQMNVSQMADGLHNYIQIEDFTSDHVKGIISTQMDGEIVLDKNFEPVYHSLMLKGDLTIQKGALLNVKPVMEVEKIPGVGLKHMDQLYFSTLKSSIFLFKNKLYVPKTEIRSSSFDAMFLGMYSFGGDYAYHIRMFLGEVLSSKSRAHLRKQAHDSGFEDDPDDITKGRTSIYLVSKYENGKEKAGLDNRKDRTNMVAKVNLQEQMVNMRFHPALVTYHTDE
ncbi:AsmA family protein [Prolixibacter denitrificans]|uniref:Uncharacterized protein involved in outer membrane biogenesis n=1 Tax=Prolixibacter denitrificans TaxID=1541063 RepID=A0A2P8CBT0_9BACT|nr:AsmA family protein [Prolixibacter denitrificans]PSK82426.1 uncharacterized protein involved in outer membrane biogenesis [Prolixibacter denitrificans]GET22832.1 hypothetical protein JCM18694_30780 [Prolixibacter denitrificans]